MNISDLFLKLISRIYVYSGAKSLDDNAEGGEFLGELRRDSLPGHVAVTTDGNRRWAKKRGLSNVEGYKEGCDAMMNFVSLCIKWDIPVVSLFLFSSENWNRPQVEVDYLMQAFEIGLRDKLTTFMSYGVRVKIIGDKSVFSISLQEAMTHAEEVTKNNTNMNLLLAMSYSGQNDITQACQSIATKVKDGLLEPENITKSLVEQALQTSVTDLPCPDLLIRTSGEFRISNYYLWQSAYSELYFTDVLWPDFGEIEFIKALRSFQQRGRRFGRK